MTDLLPLLQEFYTDKRVMVARHRAAARSIQQYDANNTCQYIINREDVQLSWLEQAIADLGAQPAEVTDIAAGPAVKGQSAADGIFTELAAGAQSFVDRWKPRVEAMANARQRGMLRVILGETLEQRRFFEQALAGRTDLLGRREQTLGPAHGEVMSTRWIE